MLSKWVEKFRLYKEGDQLGSYGCNPGKCWSGLRWHGGSWKGEMDIAIKDILKEEISLGNHLKIRHGRKGNLTDNSKILEWETWGSAAAKSLQSCPTLCNPTDGSPPGSPVPGILQARTLGWVAISFSNAWKWSCSVVSDSQRPHGLQPTRLLPWNFPGKSTGVGCHCLPKCRCH